MTVLCISCLLPWTGESVLAQYSPGLFDSYRHSGHTFDSASQPLHYGQEPSARSFDDRPYLEEQEFGSDLKQESRRLTRNGLDRPAPEQQIIQTQYSPPPLAPMYGPLQIPTSPLGPTPELPYGMSGMEPVPNSPVYSYDPQGHSLPDQSTGLPEEMGQSHCSTCEPVPCAIWSLDTSTMLFHRQDQHSSFGLVSADGGLQTLNNNQFDYDLIPGSELQLKRVGPCGVNGQQVTWMQLGRVSENLQINGANLQVLGTNLGNGTVQTQSDSTLSKLALEWTWNQSPWTEFAIGPAWWELHESTSLLSTTGAGTIQQDHDLNNRLLGLQLGVDNILYDRGGPVTLHWGLQSGVFLNAISRDSLFLNTVNATNVSPQVDESKLATVSEVHAELSYRLLPRLWCSVEYRLISMNGIAAASNQYAAAPNTALQTDGIWYHGTLLGLRGEW